MRLAAFLLSVVALGQSLPNTPLIFSIARAYEVEPVQVVAPEWVSTARYDFRKFRNPADLRQELETRFALLTRRETRPVKAWVMRRVPNAQPLAAAETGLRHKAQWGGSNTTFGGGWDMEDLARFLQFTLKTPVVDETGLGGSYVLTARLDTHDRFEMVRGFRDQLGIDLNEEYRDVEVLVVDSIYRPDPVVEPRFPCEPAGDLLLNDSIEGYRLMANRLVGTYLEARALRGTAPAKALGLLRTALDMDPDFFWADLLLAEMMFDRGNTGEGDRHLAVFQKNCPESLAAAPVYPRSSDREVMKTALANLTKVLANRFDDAAVAAYPHLWRLRRRLWEWTNDGYRNTVRADLSKIRLLAHGSETIRDTTLAEGQRLIKPESR